MLDPIHKRNFLMMAVIHATVSLACFDLDLDYSFLSCMSLMGIGMLCLIPEGALVMVLGCCCFNELHHIQSGRRLCGQGERPP